MDLPPQAALLAFERRYASVHREQGPLDEMSFPLGPRATIVKALNCKLFDAPRRHEVAMQVCRAVAFRYLLPTLCLVVLPYVWTGSNASRAWEFFEAPPGFALQLVPATLLVLGTLVAQAWGLDRRADATQARDRLFAPRWNAVFFIGVFALFLVRAGEYSDIFPVHHEGETNSAINGARLVAEHGPFAAYNTGFGLVFRPFFDTFGYNFLIARRLTIAVWGVSLVSLLVLYSGLRRGANNLLLFVPPVFVAMILPSLRTYTWHAGAAVASVASFVLVAAVASPARVRTRLALAATGLVLYSLGFTAYHAAVLYLPLTLLIVGVGFVFGWRADRLALVLMAGIIVVLAGSACLISAETAYPLAGRIRDELFDSRPNWSKGANLLRSWDNFFYSFLLHDASFAVRLLFLTGLVGCVRAFGTCLFARTSLVAFSVVYGMQLFLWGHSDWSQNCYTIVPILGILIVGLQGLAGILGGLRPPWAHALAVVIATAGISAGEYRHYFTAGLFNDRQYEQSPYDTKIQLTLALRDARAASHAAPEDIVFLLPALDGPPQPVAYEAAGLEWKSPRARRMLDRVRYYSSPDDLARQVRDMRALSARRLRVYFGLPSPDALAIIDTYLAALPDASLVVREPYHDVLHPHARLLLAYADIPADTTP